MPFPESDRVLYSNNPLVEVICQLRFPTILKITSSEPTEFQESIRQSYPLYREKQAPQVPQNIVGFLENMTIPVEKTGYEFLDEDSVWMVSLTKDFLSLSAKNYTKWEDFRSHLDDPVKSLKEIYSPAFFSRIGLRYRDVIRKSELGLSDASWADLLKPHIAGELVSSDIPLNSIKGSERFLSVELAEVEGSVNIRHGLLGDENGNMFGDTFYIDADFFIEGKVSIDDAEQILTYFNRCAGRLFRWCITEELHSAMGPKPIKD